jgi:hypothetical protein
MKNNKIKKVMQEYKKGKLHSSSPKGPVVTNVKQAIAIALSEQRKTNKKPKPPDLTNPKNKTNIQKPLYRGNPNNRRNLKDYWTT